MNSKIYLLATALALFTIKTTIAQSSERWNFGVHAGINSAYLSEFESSDARVGLNVGAFTKLNFADSGLSLRLGVNYSEQGVKNLDETIEGDVINLSYSGDREWNVLQIPLMLQYTYKHRIGIFLGPQISFLTEEPQGSTQNPIFSGVIGVEGFLTKNIFTRLQYDNALTEAFTGLNQQNFPGGSGSGTISPEAKQRVLTFAVGYQW
ncbi:hypothetical protein BST97_12995 [Nonlabens spongiae]|uniref:Outer membrane protein beta-barrel domain-containing protein n=1 Tax=Nonlabens spongiae TaxID=331648 RepID=A0A1W6MMK9_9FLAO|nr:porin family protein [Nonlabens spongiae]ARN78833.1 hypothetical protein BST97_12995 [Nonlabens spongiae]